MTIMKKQLLFAAVASIALFSCTSDDLAGGNPGTEQATTDAIAFGSGFKALTRSTEGAAAADLLGNQFVVFGVKGDGTGKDQSTVFANYVVKWQNGTAATTASNTSNWEYVGVNPIASLTGTTSQMIKFWDYSTTAYDFAAFSVGKGNTIITEEPTGGIPANSILATPIKYTTTTPSAQTAGYTLKGSSADLAECYITDMQTITKASNNYGKEVELQFRSLGSKVRMAIYETIPGYSVQNVHFYTDDATAIANNTTISNTNATLFGTDAFYTGGLYTITFPTLGSGNSGNTDYNKVHVAISGQTATGTQSFGTLNYTSSKLATSSANPSYAGTSPYYVTVLPNENGNVLEMRVNYELIADDGSGEIITIHGAKAYVPAIYTKWIPNFAYTYIFKISDNTKGWTSTTTTDPEGLYPITFDAVVLDPTDATYEQTTITTVAMPSITTYQKDHAAANDEYAAGDIYVQVMNNSGALITDLNHQTSSAYDKAFLYTLSEPSTEAKVMDALNLRASEAGGKTYITGRNGLKLTPANFDPTITTIPGENGKDITVTAGTAAKFTATATTYYAFVYLVNDAADTDVKYPVVLTGSTAPDDWSSTANVYYIDADCTNAANTAYAAGTYYRKYTDLNNTYGVKVIKVQ
jgi:hypothetical protein